MNESEMNIKSDSGSYLLKPPAVAAPQAEGKGGENGVY